jgi:hypothetical protein
MTDGIATTGTIRPCARERCATAAEDNRLTCTPDLAYALKRWDQHVRERRAVGKCVNCPSTDMKDAVVTRGKTELRCADHKEWNRAKCLAWNHAHPKRKNYKRMWVELGRCPTCRPHRVPSPGFKTCDPCRKRRAKTDRANKRGVYTLRTYTSAQVRATAAALSAAGYAARTWNLSDAR